MTFYYCSMPLPRRWEWLKVRGFSPKGEEVWIKRFRVFTMKGKSTILEYLGEFRPGVAWKMAERMVEEQDALFKLMPLTRTFGPEFLLGSFLRVYVDPSIRIKLGYPKASDRGFAWLRRLQLTQGGGSNGR
ncbi:MAG: hypothetical protein LUQ09_07710 [Methanomassiliicoccales archaeon]|nr:hypothetical protein [Methanomassiliicoccales archaeon]